ncbi:MAG: hypothetical protein WC420_03815 [Candidatus Paceibacterota bacterium]
MQLENKIWEATRKQGVFCCFEVTIGWFGKERVDYLTYDTKGVWRCYEIKVSKPDFHSKAHNTFVGNYNYYVMPHELYDQVYSEIPQDIGVYIGETCEKRAKHRELGVDEQVLKDSLIRCLYREAEKVIKSNNPTVVERLNKLLDLSIKESKTYKQKYWDLVKER